MQPDTSKRKCSAMMSTFILESVSNPIGPVLQYTLPHEGRRRQEETKKIIIMQIFGSIDLHLDQLLIKFLLVPLFQFCELTRNLGSSDTLAKA